MSDLPSLPESNEPFEVLGIDDASGLDEKALRRAYIRRIKIYRPDRHPDEFARVRRAYEAAQRELQWRAMYGDDPDWFDDDEDAAPHPYADDRDPGAETLPDEIDLEDGAPVAEETGEAPRPEPVDPVDARVREAWASLGAGGDVREILLHLREPWDDARIALHRALLADASGLGYREEVLAAMQRGLPVSPWLATVLPPREVRRLVSEDAFTWDRLRQQPDRDGAAQLVRERIHLHLVRGRLDLAVEQVLDDDYVGDASDHTLLDWTGQEVAAVAAWADVDEIDRLDRRYSAAQIDEWTFLSPPDHRAAADALRDAWKAWRREFGTFRALRRFLVLSPIVSGDLLGELVDEVAADYLHRGATYAACFYRMADAAPELLERFTHAAESIAWRPPGDAPLEHPALARIERQLRKQQRRRGGTARTVAYEEVVRPMLTRYVVEEGISPTEVVAAFEEDRKTLPYLAGHAETIQAERMFAALYACHLLTLPAYDEDEEGEP